jgi:RNA polymerase sigma-32 factor
MPRKASKSGASKALTPEIITDPTDPAPVDLEDTDEADESSDQEIARLADEADDTGAERHPSDSSKQDFLPSSGTVPPSTSALSDPLRRYLEEAGRIPLLSPEEETRLALRMRDKGDLNAAKALVQANLRLVVKIAMEYQSVYTNLLDLIQEGNIGLMKAVSKFDPTKNARLGYYASWWIRSYILKYLLDNFRLVRIGTTQAQKKLFYHLMREKQRLEAQGLFAGPKLLAERLDVKEKEVIEMEQRLSGGGAELSIDQPLTGEEDAAPGRGLRDLLPDSSESADAQLARAEWIEILRENLPKFSKSLNPKEKKILEKRLLAEEPQTLQEIADRYGLTRERARQIEAKLIQKLREFLKEYLT